MGISKLLDAPQKKLKQLESQVERLQQTLERTRKAKRPTLGRAKSRKPGSKSAFVRLIFGDVHGEHMDRDAVRAFLDDAELLQPAEIICDGDLIDCGGFLSQHKTLGVVAELDATYEQDIEAGNFILDELQRRCPNASITYIEGNHENRINRWICDQVLRHQKNAEYLRRLMGPRTLLHLDTRGVRYIERHGYYDGLSISGTIKLEPYALAQHGEAFCGKYAAERHIERLGRSVFFGHSHRLKAVYSENSDGHIVGVNAGCLCQLRPLYALTKTTDWTHGYVVEFVDPKRGFLAMPVPIVDGVSYLGSLAHFLR